MKIPDKLINFAVYLDDGELLGIVDATLPSFTPLKETAKGAGILGEYEVGVPGHYSAMKLGFTWRHATASAIKLCAPEGRSLTLKAAAQSIDSSNYTPIVVPISIFIRQFSSDMSLGNFDPATAMGTTTEVECAYFKLDYDGTTVFELDKLNFKCVVDGVDKVAEVRAAMGR